ncbi:Protein DEHYDRATION-INDUCED 2, partial [Ananas comosus]
MDADSWSRLSSSAASRRLQSRYDLYLAFEEIGGGGGDDEASGEFNCPFCGEDFDFVGLCCHIDDEHPVEAKNGVCPICASRVGTDLAGHLDLRDGNLQSLFGGSSYMAAPPTAAPDPFLSSLIYTLPMTESKDSPSENLDCEIPVNRSLDGKTVE